MADVATVEEGTERLAELAAEDRDREVADELARRNTGFVQVYEKGWERLRGLINSNPSAARLYAFLAENIDGSCGAVVVSQEFLSEELKVHVRTVRRLTKVLENENAIVRIKVGTGVYAYALDPEEVWRSWDSAKDTAAFHTKTLVRKLDRANGQVRRKLKMMMGGKAEEATDA